MSAADSGPIDEAPALPPPAVAASAYDADYYTRRCIGAEEWQRSGGAEIAGIYTGFLRRAGLRPGEVLVDLGTGRGDMLAAAIAEGAARAYGIEYSPSGVELASTTLAAHAITDRAEVLLADARAVPLPDATADLVTMLEVAEHLAPDELHRALSEARRLLRPGGRLVLHTMPNRLIYSVTYRALRALTGGRWPAEPRNRLELEMHINELTLGELRAALGAAGLDGEVTLGQWVYTDHLPGRWPAKLHHIAARFPPLRRFVIADLWAVARVATPVVR